MLMERSREARRSVMAAANGLSRRRQRSTSLRESHVVEEDVQMELQDTVRLRNRANKRERERDRYRDREFSNHHNIQSKRRRGDRLTVGEEEGTEESVADEEDFDIEERRLVHTISHNTTSFSSSVLNQSSRKNSTKTKLVRQSPSALKAADEFIGALVPRKARSAFVKRSHESWLSGNGGFWEDEKASSTSPAGRRAEANSPSSSNVSVRKEMNPNGHKTRLPKVVKCSSSSVQQANMEIEIAEVLFGLSQNSKEDGDNLGKPESKDAKGISQDTKSSVAVLPQNTNPASDLLPNNAALKKKKAEADNSSIPVSNGSVSSSVKIENKTENSASKSEQKASHEVYPPKVASMTVEPQEEVTKQGDSNLSIEGSGSPGGTVTEKKSISAKDSAPSLKMDVDFQDSTVKKMTSVLLENDSRKEERFKIDLMAPPPVVSSSERGGFFDFTSYPTDEANDVKMKSLVKDEENTDRFLNKESAEEEVEDKKMEAIGEKRLLKIDLEKPNQVNGRDSSLKLQQQNEKRQQLQSKSTIAKVEKTESSSVPLKISAAGWRNGLQPLGYMPRFQTSTPMDDSTRSSTAQQTPPFMLSQPRPKRCATHCYIACNVYLNQQWAKMSPFWPEGAGSASASLPGAKPNYPNVMPSAENLIHGNPLQGSFPHLNLSSGQDKGQAVASFPLPAQKDKSSEGDNFNDPAQKRHAPAFIFPVSQQQAVVTAPANQPGPSKSAATSTKSATVSGNSTAALPASSTTLPAVAAAVSYNFPNLAGNESPYFSVLQNNGYPFPVPTPIGTVPAIRGETHAQAFPFFNGSFYSSQIFHPSQLQYQQQPHSQPLLQAANQNKTALCASSSSHKQLHSQQPRGVPVGGNNFMSSMSMQSQQMQKHVSSSNQNRKLEAEMSGEDTPSVADGRFTHNQTSLYSKNLSVPLQPLNFALMPSPAVGGGSTGGTHSEKQQQSQQKILKGGVELIPQSFAMSFASFSGSNSPSNLNFSSLQHNPAIFQSLPDMTRQAYQVVPVAQAAPQKNHQITEVKTGGGSSNHDEGKKSGLGGSSAINVQTLVFDDSARTLNFGSSPIPGNWPSGYISSTAITTNPIAANSQNFQQQQLLHFQKQQMLQQQQQSTAAARSKAQTSNCLPSSAIADKLSKNGPTFSKTIVQSNSSSQSFQWKNSARNQTNQVPTTSITSSSTNVSRQQVRSPQGHTQISFERHSKSGLAPQGQQIAGSNQSNISLSGSKAGPSIPTVQAQLTENSSSPVCRRNVPSILSACPSHLSELKY